MSNFINTTSGLECNKNEQIGKMIKVEYSRNEDGSVTLNAVNGHTLGAMSGVAKISAAEFENRPRDAYNSVIETRWALNKVGWSLMSDDELPSA